MPPSTGGKRSTPSKERVSAAIAYVRARQEATSQKTAKDENGPELESPKGRSRQNETRLPLTPSRMNSPSGRQTGASEKSFFGSPALSLPPLSNKDDGASTVASPLSSVGFTPRGGRSRRQAAAMILERRAQSSPRISVPPSPQTSANPKTEKPSGKDSDASSLASESISTDVVLGFADFIDTLNKSSTDDSGSSKNGSSSDVASSALNVTLDPTVLKHLGDYIDRLNHHKGNTDDAIDAIQPSTSSSLDEEEVDPERLQQIASFIDNVAKAKSVEHDVVANISLNISDSSSDESTPTEINAETLQKIASFIDNVAKAKSFEHDGFASLSMKPSSSFSDESTIPSEINAGISAFIQSLEMLKQNASEQVDDSIEANRSLYVSSGEETHPVASHDESVVDKKSSLGSPVNDKQIIASTGTKSSDSDPFASTGTKSSDSCLNGEDYLLGRPKKVYEEDERYMDINREAIEIDEESHFNNRVEATLESLSKEVASLDIESSVEGKFSASIDTVEAALEAAYMALNISSDLEQELPAVKEQRLTGQSIALCDEAVEVINGFRSQDGAGGVTVLSPNATLDVSLYADAVGKAEEFTGADVEYFELVHSAVEIKGLFESQDELEIDLKQSIEEGEEVTGNTSECPDTGHTRIDSMHPVEEQVEGDGCEINAFEENVVIDSKESVETGPHETPSVDIGIICDREDSLLNSNLSLGESGCIRAKSQLTTSLDVTLSYSGDPVDGVEKNDAANMDIRSISKSQDGFSSGSQWTEEEVLTGSWDETVEISVASTKESCLTATDSLDPSAPANTIMKNDITARTVDGSRSQIDEEAEASQDSPPRLTMSLDLTITDPSTGSGDATEIGVGALYPETDDQAATEIHDASIEISKSANSHDEDSENVGSDPGEHSTVASSQGRVVEQPTKVYGYLIETQESFNSKYVSVSEPSEIDIDPIETSRSIPSQDEKVLADADDGPNEAPPQDDPTKTSSTSPSQDENVLADANDDPTELSNEALPEDDAKLVKEITMNATKAGPSERSQSIHETISEDRESYILNAFLTGSDIDISVDPILPDPSTMESIDEEENITRFQERLASTSSNGRSRDTGDGLMEVNQIEFKACEPPETDIDAIETSRSSPLQDKSVLADVNGGPTELSNEALTEDDAKLVTEITMNAIKAGGPSERSPSIRETISEDRESYLLNAFLTGSDIDISVDPILPDPSTMESIDEDENIARFQERLASTLSNACSRDTGKLPEIVGDQGEIEDSEPSETDVDPIGSSSSSPSQDQNVVAYANCGPIELSNEAPPEDDAKLVAEVTMNASKADVPSERSQSIHETISEDRESYILNAFLTGSDIDISVDPILPDPSTMESIDEDENIKRFQERLASTSFNGRYQGTGDEVMELNGYKIEISEEATAEAGVQQATEKVSTTAISLDSMVSENIVAARSSTTGSSTNADKSDGRNSYLSNAFLLESASEISLDPILPDPSTMKSLDEDENIERFLAKAFTLPEGSTKEELLMLNTFIKEVTDLVENGGTAEQRENLVKSAIRNGLPKDIVEEVLVCLVCGPENGEEESNSDRSADNDVRLGTPTSTVSSLGEELERILRDPNDDEVEVVNATQTAQKEMDEVTVENTREAKSVKGGSQNVMDSFIDKLAPREGASANEIELLSEFMKLAAPVLSGKRLSHFEEMKLRSAAGGVGISERLLNQLLRDNTSLKDSLSGTTQEPIVASNDDSLERSEIKSDRYLADKSSSTNAISSSLEVDAKADAVEVSFDMSYSEMKGKLIGEIEEEDHDRDWFDDETCETDSTSHYRDVARAEKEVLDVQVERLSKQLAVETDHAITDETIHRAMWSPAEDFQGERYAMPATPLLGQEESTRMYSAADNSVDEMERCVSPKSRLQRHSRYSPSKRLTTPARLGGAAAAAVISRWSPRRSSHLRHPVKQQWKLSYRERTKNHPGYFEVNLYSLKEMSVPVTFPHILDSVPWEDREVKQRFLHEHSVAFSRNWFGVLQRKRGNDKYREPVAHPDSMAMPMTHRQAGNWPEEWYTTWQSRKLFRAEHADDSSESSYSCGSSRSPDDDHTGSILSGSAISGSVYTRDTRGSDYFDDEVETDGESTWDDYYDEYAPECGHIVNVKQKIGERESRVNPYTTSSLRRSRWRRKYFPRGTFPY